MKDGGLEKEPINSRTFVECINDIEDAMDEGFYHGGIGTTWINPLGKYPYIENSRVMTNKFYNGDELSKVWSEIDWEGCCGAEDFYVSLQLMTRGFNNKVWYKYVASPSDTNTVGGCSEYRDIDYHNKSMKNLQSKFPNYISLKEKKNVINESEVIATRKSSEKIISFLTKKIPNIIGGSADLSGSNNTKTKNHQIIKPGNFRGNYIHYGVREHAMCGIMNGLALHSELIPYGGTFLIFSDYCKPSIRLSAIMKQKVIYVMSHDSIGLGEDGPTHQPIEQLAGLRSIPNLNVFRPADSTETFECWEHAINDDDTPSIIAVSRQKVNPIRKEFTKENKCSAGAYEVVRTKSEINLTILTTGSEVNLAIEVSQKLATENIYSKVISMPCHELFDKQNKDYKSKILDETKHKISIEASTTDYWKKYIGENGIAFGIDDFGKSAPYKKIYEHFGLTSESIVKKIKEMINT